jgi:hypothetical protein
MKALIFMGEIIVTALEKNAGNGLLEKYQYY